VFEQENTMRGIDGKTVIVTGGGGGIGAPTCMRFAQEGARVVVMDVNAAAAQETVQKIQNSGGQAIACAVDLRDAAKTQARSRLSKRILARLISSSMGWVGMFLHRFSKADRIFGPKLLTSICAAF